MQMRTHVLALECAAVELHEDARIAFGPRRQHDVGLEGFGDRVEKLRAVDRLGPRFRIHELDRFAILPGKRSSCRLYRSLEKCRSVHLREPERLKVGNDLHSPRFPREVILTQ